MPTQVDAWNIYLFDKKSVDFEL